MTDIGTGFLEGVSAFLTTRLGESASGAWKDAGSLVDSLHDGVPDNTKPAWEQLKTDVKNASATVSELRSKIKKQTDLIGKLATEAKADMETGDFTVAKAGRVSSRLAQALLAADQAANLLATELVKTLPEAQREPTRLQLMGLWNPVGQPLRALTEGAGDVLDAFGDTVLGVEDTTKKLSEEFEDKTLDYSADKFELSVEIVGVDRDLGMLKLKGTRLVAFLGFGRLQVTNPTEEQKASLVERDEKWWRADDVVLGLRFSAKLEPVLAKNELMKALAPGQKEPEPTKATPVTLDTSLGLYLGDGGRNDKVVLPFLFSSPVVEVRDLTLALARNDAKEVTGFDLTALVAAKLGDAVGLLIGGIGATVSFDGDDEPLPFGVSVRWPDMVGIRINTGPVKGGGYLERKTRTYDGQEITEFGGILQLEILKAGVFAVGILSPSPFSLVLVMGVRFPTAIELSFGFTLNGVGGILAINRTVDTTELIAGMKTHFIDKVLFPEDPLAEAPALLEKVAKVFPVRSGGFVVGPIVELGWGSQARIVEAKLGVVLALPDPKVIVLGAVRVRAPSKVTPLTDFRCEVYGEISADRLLLVATLRDSKIAGITVSGDLGLLIQWGGGGDFALSVGGFNPRYTEVPADLKGLERITMDLSPPAVVKIAVKAYFAVTAGAVMAGVRGDFSADLGFASGKAWLQLDAIFRWVPTFGFVVDLDLGIDIKVFGASFAQVGFTGALEGTTPWRVQGKGVVDVWWLPTVNFDVGPYTWGQGAAALAAPEDPLTVARQGLDAAEAWKALLPADGDQLVMLGRVEGVTGLVAHPLSCLEVTQSRLPLETHIDRIGSAAVSAHRVAMGLPQTSTGAVAAVSTVTAPFAPGQFLALEGEALLARSGFDDMPSGCRIAAATTPTHGTAVAASVTWDTYFREEDTQPVSSGFAFGTHAALLIGHGLPQRHLAERDNPYLPRTAAVTGAGADAVTVMPAGSARVVRADDHGGVLADLGVMTASQAAWAADLVNTAEDEELLVSLAVGGGGA